MRDLPFDYHTAFMPVTQISSFPQVIAVKSDFPARNDRGVHRAGEGAPRHHQLSARRRPPAWRTWRWRAFEQQAGIRLMHAPYRGGADAARDIIAGVIDAVLITTSSIRPPVAAGKARVLAVTSLQRVPSLPGRADAGGDPASPAST